ncbi:MAG: hypothetical protein ACYTEZ_06600 [Planctomycetota bacterium]|jgi:hypothetical protein
MARGIIALLLLAAPALAGETDLLREDIAALTFLQQLNLSPEQAQAILPVAAKGAILQRDVARKRNALYVKLHGALLRFKEQDLRNQGLTPDVIAAAGGTNGAIKHLNLWLARSLEPLEEEAALVLSPAQRGLVFPAQKGHPLDLLRKLKGSDFEEVRDRLARSLANSRVRADLVDRHARRDERQRIRALLLQVRRWDDGEYRARRDELLDALVPGRKRAKVASEIRRIYRARYGQVGPLGNHLFREKMLPVLAERAGVAAPKLPPPTGPRLTISTDLDHIKREIASLKADINLLNLMNGLHLERDQLREIVRSAKACAAARPPEGKIDERELQGALREVREALRKGKPAPAGALYRTRSPLAKRGSGYLQARRRELVEAQTEGVERLCGALTPGQKQVISTYSPCLVPPKNLRDPVRVGQARDTGPLEILLDVVRGIELDENAYQVAEKLLTRIEQHHGHFPAAERICRINLLLGVAYEAQGLDEVGYAARRTELATRLEPLQRLPALKETLHAIDGDDALIRSKIAAFLLAPRMVPLAKDRLARLAKPEKLERPDIPKAEICEDGKCGKP